MESFGSQVPIEIPWDLSRFLDPAAVCVEYSRYYTVFGITAPPVVRSC